MNEISIDDLLGNAQAAMLAAVELYNKPKFHYRDEVVVILVVNAWGLILKASLMKRSLSIFYPQRGNEPLRTLSWQDALKRLGQDLPKSMGADEVGENLRMLHKYRNEVEHYYAQRDFRVVLYQLLQTSVVNFSDLLETDFGMRFADEIDLRLLPLAISPPLDPVSYLKREVDGQGEGNAQVHTFLTELQAAVGRSAPDGGTGRIMTVFDVHLRSCKKLESADFVIAVGNSEESPSLSPERTLDPNKTHPFRQKDLLVRLAPILGNDFNSYTFQAVAWKHRLKSDLKYCWKSDTGTEIRYSPTAEAFIKRLSDDDIAAAIEAYKAHQAANRKSAACPKPSKSKPSPATAPA